MRFMYVQPFDRFRVAVEVAIELSGAGKATMKYQINFFPISIFNFANQRRE